MRLSTGLLPIRLLRHFRRKQSGCQRKMLLKQ
jgi:hypothetical protein